MPSLAWIVPILTLSTLAVAQTQAQWSTATLSLKRTGLASASVGGLALFAGGGEDPPQMWSPSHVVDVYDSVNATWSSTTTTPSMRLSVARTYLAAASVNNLALFAGGATSSFMPSAVVDVFDAQTMSWSTATLSQARGALSATTVGTKVLFAGGIIGNTQPRPVTDRVDIYDASIGPPSNPAAWSTATLSQPRGLLAAASVGGKALFAGGLASNGVPSAVVDIYDDSTGQWSSTTLSQARTLDSYAAVSLGTRAYFAGGMTNPNPMIETRSDRVDIYDATTGTWSNLTLSSPRSGLGAGAVGNTVLFAGGWRNTTNHVAVTTVDILDATTGTWLAPAALCGAHTYMDAVTVGGRVMFPGGKRGSGLGTTNLIDVYDPAIGTARFGSGCGNPALDLSPVASARPRIGATAQAALTNIPSAIAFVALGWSNTAAGALALPFSLAVYGMPGCDLLQSAEAAAQPVTFTGTGTATYSLPLPNIPGLLGLHVYLQGWAPAPGVNAGNTIVSNGIEWVICGT